MKYKILTVLLLISCIQVNAQTFTAVNRCGGTTVLDIPDFTDNDIDGLSDELEQVLLDAYIPKFVQYTDDDCPGPATGTSNLTDSNLVVCHIFPLFQQYVNGSNAPVLYTAPTAIVNENCLHTGISWYENTVMIYAALLYGRDCGLNGHTADVEGVAVSVKYTGTNDGIAWRSDTDLNHWEGYKIQTTSHAGTICEGIETFPFRSISNPNGKDTIYPSPDKHGNYLTEQQCSSSFICDPACDDPFTLKNIKIVNVGELNNPFVTDLGQYYSGYTGENPWSDVNFLSGNAGTVKEKMLREWRDDYIQGLPVNSCTDICAIYNNCYNCGNDVYNACISDCQNISNNQTGCNSPEFNCSVTVKETTAVSNEINVYPNPAKTELNIEVLKPNDGYSITLINSSGQVVKSAIAKSTKTKLDLTGLAKGVYSLKVENLKFALAEKQIIIE